jgi:hypothetical protein
MILKIILAIIIVLTIIVVYRLMKDKNQEKIKDKNQEKIKLAKSESNIDNNPDKSDIATINNYIYPKPFRASSLIFPKKPYYSMNNCDHSVLYPINSLDVEYGSKFPDCRCTEYVQAP